MSHQGASMACRRSWLGVLGAVCLLSSAASASAQGADCAARPDEARRERAGGKLLEAREHFVVCAEQCSSVIADPCRAAAAELLAAEPTFVIEARDAEGHDLSDVAVSVDGTNVAQELDGKAIAVDPGPHQVTLVWRGSIERIAIVAKEGAKAEPLRVRFRGVADGEGPARDLTGHTIWPWAVVAAGGAIVVGGIAVVLTAPSLPAGCDSNTKTCSATPSETAQAFHQRQLQAGQSVGQPLVGGVTIAIGAVVVGGALAWHFLESAELGTRTPTGKVRVRHLAPWFAREGGGVAAGGTF